MAQRVKRDIHLYQGDDKAFQFTLTMNGAAYNLAAATSVKMHVKQAITDASVKFSVSATDGVGGNDWDAGIVVITISDTQSAGLTGNAVYDLEIVIGTTTTTACYGDIFLAKQVGTTV